MDLWNNTTTLERAAFFTPYVFIVLGALVAASGIYLKGVIDKRIVLLDERANQRAMNTPPQIKVRLGTSTSGGDDIVGKTLLQITAKNDIEFNANWLVTTRNNTVVSPIMTSQFHVVPSATPVIKTPVTINDDRVVDEYIELRFHYQSIHSAELGNPKHLRGEITLPYRYADGRVYMPTREMFDYWRANHPPEPAAAS